MFHQFPYTNLHEINLDWIIKRVMEAYSPDNPPENIVLSVNGQTGNVTLYENPSVILPEITSDRWSIFRNSAGTTLGIRFTNGKVYRINSINSFELYDAGNPPPYPVKSVNGQTGNVTLQLPFVNTAPELLEFQTDSPGDYWGMMRNTTNGEVGIYFDSENNTVKAYINYMPEDESTTQPQTFQLLTTNDIPSSSGVVSVNGKSGVVVIRGTDISRTANNAETVETALARIDQKDSSQDNAISGLQEGIAIIADGDTHTAIQAGQAVFVKNHGTLATGLYWANSAIGTNVALTSSNLTADTTGGFNHLQSEISSLNSNITPVGFDITNGEKISSFYSIRRRMGKLCVISGYLAINAQLSAGDVIVTLPFSATNTAYRFTFTKSDGSGKAFFAKLNASNQIVVDDSPSGTGSNQYYLFDIVFFAD